MRPNPTRRLSRLRQLVKEAGSAAELSRLTGIKEAQFSHWERGVRKMRDSTASRLEAARGKPPGWMDRDDEPEASAGDQVPRTVPLIALDEVRKHIESMDHSAAEHSWVDTVVHPDPELDRRAFALRIKGDSMESSDGKYSFPEGCIVIVVPTETAEPGEHVIVQLSTAKEAVFKKLVEFDGQRWLKPLNSVYPISPMPADARILGVVVSVQHHEEIPRLSRALI
jgi:SOS-response transcriptional repressor LexA